MLDNVEELEENLVENALLSLLGKKHHINDLSHFCDIYNKYIRKNGYSFVLTPLKFITYYSHKKYFFKILSFSLDPDFVCDFNDDIEMYERLTLLDDNFHLDLTFSEKQYKEVCVMTNKRVSRQYSFSVVSDLCISDIDLFISSFDQSIDDTFSREYLLDELSSFTPL